MAPTDEEFRARARDIVAATGNDQRAALVQIDAFGEEVGQKMVRAVEEFAKSAGIDVKDLDEEPPLPPPPP